MKFKTTGVDNKVFRQGTGGEEESLRFRTIGLCLRRAGLLLPARKLSRLYRCLLKRDARSFAIWTEAFCECVAPGHATRLIGGMND